MKDQRGRGNAAHRVTLDDVARVSGVSRATVSRVVNGSHPVEPGKVVAVRAAVEALGYVPNLVARSLMTRRTDMVALVAGEPDVRVFTDPLLRATTEPFWRTQCQRPPALRLRCSMPSSP
jgi:DNA-binding LacI/PurR family transcriptional regulator